MSYLLIESLPVFGRRVVNRIILISYEIYLRLILFLSFSSFIRVFRASFRLICLAVLSFFILFIAGNFEGYLLHLYLLMY